MPDTPEEYLQDRVGRDQAPVIGVGADPLWLKPHLIGFPLSIGAGFGGIGLRAGYGKRVRLAAFPPGYRDSSILSQLPAEEEVAYQRYGEGSSQQSRNQEDQTHGDQFGIILHERLNSAEIIGLGNGIQYLGKAQKEKQYEETDDYPNDPNAQL